LYHQNANHDIAASSLGFAYCRDFRADPWLKTCGLMPKFQAIGFKERRLSM